MSYTLQFAKIPQILSFGTLTAVFNFIIPIYNICVQSGFYYLLVQNAPLSAFSFKIKVIYACDGYMPILRI